MQARHWKRWLVLGVVAVTAAACGDDDGSDAAQNTTGDTETSAGRESESASLADVCPARISVQTDWFPQPEHGATYQLAGLDGEIDADRGVYVNEIGDTGVELEIRAGGPFIGFSPPVAQMYSEGTTLGFSDTGDQIRNSATLPTVAIVSPLERSPQILMYDPATFDFSTVEDVRDAGAPVIYQEGAAYMDFLVSEGLLNREQLDASYDGSPVRWVSEGGAALQQGYLTSEPYTYEHDLPEWGKPVGSLLLYDAGWEVYQSSIVTTPENVEELADCFAVLVPMFQQATVDYIAEPEPINALISQIDEEYASFFMVSEDLAADAVQKMVDNDIVGNGTDETVGNFDTERVQKMIDLLVPLFLDQGLDSVDSGVTPKDLVTNEFIDTSIGF